MRYNRGSVLWVSLTLLILMLPQGVRATTYYTYDTLGRVTQVVESDGTTTQYNYDANGNITSIDRTAGTSVLSIGSVSSSSGASGSSVTITGSGFSSIPSQDAVTFNGVAATVTYASGNRLVVTVPPGATTGDISIATPSSSVTSANSFTVVPVSVSSFSPTSGVVGTALTVNGGGFDPTPANNIVSINGIPATVTSATVTQLQVTVPSGATPGHISVTSPLGSATGTGYFFVPAAGYTPSQIAEVVVESPGVAEVLPINAANQVAVILFDGVAGQRFSMATTNDMSGARPGYTLYAPDGSTVASDLTPANEEVQLAPLTQTGTYAWYFRPDSIPASATYQLLTDVVGQLPTDGTPTPTSLAPGQNATYTFAGAAGQFYNLTLTQFSPTGYVDASVFNPDGSLLIDCGGYQAYYNNVQNCVFTVSTTATYTLRIVPGSNALAPASFNTYVVQDFSATLTAGTPGPTVGVSLVPEQNGNLNFTATANQTLALYVAPMLESINDSITLRMSGPGPIQDNVVTLDNGVATTYTYNLPNLGAGNYLVTIRPDGNGAAVSTTATLANGVTGTLTTGGAPTTLQTYVPAQNAYLTFNGTQGQSLSLVLSQLALTPSSVNSASVSITNPDGSALTSGTCYSSSIPGCSVSLGVLPQTGSYSVVVSTDGQATLNLAVALQSNVTGTVSLNDPTTVTLSSQGQEAALTFVAANDEDVILSVSSITATPANTPVTFYIYNSSGKLEGQVSLTTGGTLDVGTVVAGTYTLVVAPDNAATASMSVDLTPGASAALTLDDTPYGLGTSTAGQSAYVTFNATAGQSVGVALSNLQFTPSSVTSATVTIYNPDGSQLWSSSCSASTGCVPDYRGLTQTGTYSITITPSGAATMSFTAAASLNLTDSLVANTPYNLALSEVGQNAMLSFSVISGQSFTLQISNFSTVPANAPVTVVVYESADYGQQPVLTTITSATTFSLSNLSQGTYVVWISPQTPATTSMQVTLAAPNVAAVPADGSSTTITTTSPGQYEYVTFNATAGQSIGAALTDLSISSGSSGTVNLELYDANGNAMSGESQTCAPGGNGCMVNWIYLPTTGTYHLVIVPSGQFTMSFTLTVSTNVTGQLTPGTAMSVSLASVGQCAALTFTVASGQNVTVTVSDATVTPSGTTTYVGLNYASQGYQNLGYITGQNFTTPGVTFNANGWAAGTYLVWIQYRAPAIGSMQVLATYQ